MMEIKLTPERSQAVRDALGCTNIEKCIHMKHYEDATVYVDKYRCARCDSTYQKYQTEHVDKQ